MGGGRACTGWAVGRPLALAVMLLVPVAPSSSGRGEAGDLSPAASSPPATDSTMASACTLSAAPTVAWTNPFDYNQGFPGNPNPGRISYAPRSAWMIFPESAPPKISTADGSSMTVFDLDGVPRYHGPPALAPGLPPGHYVVQSSSDRSQFLVVPDAYRGAGFLAATGVIPTLPLAAPFMAESMRSAKVPWMRVYVDWRATQPRGPEEWNWGAADLRMKANEGFRILFLFDGFPRPAWVSDADFIPRFTDFVRQGMARYAGRLGAVEVLNEPDGVVGTDALLPNRAALVPFYTSLLRSVYPALKEIDASVPVIGMGLTGAWLDLFEGFAQAGAGKYLDGVAWHEYRMNNFPPDQDFRPNGVHFRRVDDFLARMRSLFPGKPFYITETGLPGMTSLGEELPYMSEGSGDATFADWHVAMTRAIRLMVMLRAGGAELILSHLLNFHAVWRGWPWHGWEAGTIFPDLLPRGPKPKTSAFLMTGSWLEGASFVGQRVVDDRVFVYAFERQDGSSLVFAWTIEGTSALLNPSAALVRSVDVFHRRVVAPIVDENPRLFLSGAVPPGALLDLVAGGMRLAAGPFPLGGLVGSWKFEEGVGRVALDSSGNGNHGSLQGGVAHSRGTVGLHALTFDGATGHVRVPDSSSLRSPRDAVTVAAWMRWDASGTSYFQPYFVKRESATKRLEFGPTLGGSLIMAWGNGQTWVDSIVPLELLGIRPGEWAHLAFVGDGTGVCMYVDGIQRKNVYWFPGRFDIAADVLLGRNLAGSAFKGSLDEVAVWKRALTPVEVDAVYRAEV